DQRGETEVRYLRERGLYVLPVAEVENLLLLPNVFLALAHALSCADPPGLLCRLEDEVIKVAKDNIDLISARYASRLIDARLKRLELESKDLTSLQITYQAAIADIDPSKLFGTFRTEMERTIAAKDLAGVLRLYDNKGLLATASRLLGISG